MNIIKNKIFIIVILLLIILFSIKPFVFTYNYLIAKYHINISNNIDKYGKFVVNAVKYNNNSYVKFEKHLIKSFILYDTENVYELIDEKFKKKIEIINQNNFYFQNYLNNINAKKNWQKLNKLSYFFLADKKYNNLTKSILNKLDNKFDKKFLFNLCDFLFSRNNTDMGDFIIKKYSLKSYFYKKQCVSGNNV